MATVQDVIFGTGATPATAYAGVYTKLSRRDDIVATPNLAIDWVYKTVMELTANFPFQELQITAPDFNLVSGQYAYDYPTALSVTTGAIPKQIASFYMFYNTDKTSGIQLKYKTINDLELMFGTPGMPAYWSRFGNQFFVAPVPNLALPVRIRYQVEHPFSGPPALTDVIKMPSDWLDIVELGAAERGASDLRMLDYASQYHTQLFGDPEFERSSGGKGNPGLLFRRLSQQETDFNSQMRSIRVMARR